MSDSEEIIEIDLNVEPVLDKHGNPEPVIEVVDDPSMSDPPSNSRDNPKDVDKALKKLNKKLEEERAARIEAENNARVMAARANQAANEVSDTNLHLVNGAIDSLKRDQDILKAHLRDAMTIGDYDRAAELQEGMASNFTKLNSLERGLHEMKNAPRQPVGPVSVPKADVSVDSLIERVTPKSAEWLDRNRDALPDARSIRVMARAHEDAVDYGIAPESEAYFQFVENRLGINNNNRRSIPEVDNVMSGASNSTQKRSSAPASAPVSRTPVGSNFRPGVVQLTASEVEAAKISGISPQEYYRNKMREQNRS